MPLQRFSRAFLFHRECEWALEREAPVFLDSSVNSRQCFSPVWVLRLEYLPGVDRSSAIDCVGSAKIEEPILVKLPTDTGGIRFRAHSVFVAVPSIDRMIYQRWDHLRKVRNESDPILPLPEANLRESCNVTWV